MINLIYSKNFLPPAKYVLLCLLMVVLFLPVLAQGKKNNMSREFKEFSKELTDADLNFTLPPGFKETKANNDDAFDYGIILPDSAFEIWFQVKSLKDNKVSKLKMNPDSAYIEMGRAQAITYIGDNQYIIRTIPPRALARYNADAGKTFLLNLPDSPTTKHYKYAMLVMLQKNHAGTIIATCFANELGPRFFKSLNLASSCIKFNQ